VPSVDIPDFSRESLLSLIPPSDPPAVLLSFEEYLETFASACFQFDLGSCLPAAFSGWVHARDLFGLSVADCGFNVGQMVRTSRHIRADSIDHYAAVINLSGQSTFTAGDRAVVVNAGDIVLMDKAKPATINVDGAGTVRWLAVQVPRQTLKAHLGFEPRSGVLAEGNRPVSRAFVRLVCESFKECENAQEGSESHLRTAVYAMLGALFANSAPSADDAHTHGLFLRICEIIRNSYTDPHIGPREVAVAGKISQRYLQMLFASRGLTCTQFMLSLRLDHARRLIDERQRLDTGQPLSLLAYASGFRDYNYFARAFRERFGRSPGGSSSV